MQTSYKRKFVATFIIIIYLIKDNSAYEKEPIKA